jgi:hypothetical protein
VKKKMTQIIEEVLVEEVEQIEEPESLGDLNPKYFEEAMSMDEAKDRIHAAKAYSNNLFNTYGF